MQHRIVALEPELAYLQSANESVDHTTHVAARNQIVEHHRKQCALSSSLTLYEAHEKCPCSPRGHFPTISPINPDFRNSLRSRGLLLKE